MNTNHNQPRRRPAPQPNRTPASCPTAQQPQSANAHGAQYNHASPPPHPVGRSAAPHPVDTRGARQRTRQYSDAHRQEIDRIQRANPEAVRHKHYQSSYAAKRRQKQNVILVLVIFLALCLGLLLVFGAAKLIKHLKAPGEGTDSSVTTSAADQTEPDDTSGTVTDTEAVTTEKEEPIPVYAQPTDSTVEMNVEISSTNAILIDLKTHTIVAQKDSDERIFPASMTKIMTLLVAVENMDSLDQLATVTKETVDYCYLEGASVAGFKANEVVTVEDLLYGTILPSGADATKTLAECIAGSEEGFVKLMNAKAADLGLTGTNFINTSGLHDDRHYSTVHDIALILKAALDNDICYKVLCARRYVTSSTPQNENGLELISLVYKRTNSINTKEFEIVGGKTGYTPEANYCLSTYTVTADGKGEYILVTANAKPDKNAPVKDAQYVFKTYAVQKEEQTDVAA